MTGPILRCGVCDAPADRSCTARRDGFECKVYRCRLHPCNCHNGTRRRLWGHREWISQKRGSRA